MSLSALGSQLVREQILFRKPYCGTTPPISHHKHLEENPTDISPSPRLPPLPPLLLPLLPPSDTSVMRRLLVFSIKAVGAAGAVGSLSCAVRACGLQGFRFCRFVCFLLPVCTYTHTHARTQCQPNGLLSVKAAHGSLEDRVS